MTKERIVVGIDVGTTKVATLIAEVGRNRHAHVVGAGIAPARGIKKGVVVDIDETAEAVLVSLERAERIAGHKVSSASVSVSGAHITSLNNRAYVAVTRSDRTITDEDVARVVDAAQVINVPSNREILHAIPRQFIVDGQDGIRNPVGMLGYRLDVEVHIVTGAVMAIQNLARCLNTVGVAVDDVILAPLAASEAVLTEEEKGMGVALVDLGGGTTEVAVFVDDSICHTGIISVGGNHITNDIAVRLRTPFPEAEDLKVRYAHAYSSEIEPDELIDVPSFGRTDISRVPRRDVCEVAEARLHETFQLVGEEIRRSAAGGILPAGAVLVGGSAQMSGVVELASEVLGLPVRLGRPTGIHGLLDSVNGPAFAASIGLVLWSVRYSERRAPRSRPATHSFARGDDWGGAEEGHVGGRIRGWLRAILP